MTHDKPQSSIFTGYVHPVAFLSAQNAITLRTAPSLVIDKCKLHSNLHCHVFFWTISDISTHQCSNFVLLFWCVCVACTQILRQSVPWRQLQNGQYV